MRLVLVMLMLAGCTMSRPPIAANVADPCSGNITGAVTQAFDTCTASWTTTPDQLAQVAISSKFATGAPLGDFSITFAYFGVGKAIQLGNMETTFFHGEVDDVTQMPAVPYQVYNDTDGQRRGSAEITLSNVVPIGVTDYGAVWDVHGTLTATFDSASATGGDAGSLDVSLTF